MKTTPTSLKALAMSVLVLIGAVAQSTAGTFVVKNAKDSGPGSLREALAQANSNGEPDTINFDPVFFAAARTIVLASELQITMDGANPGRLVTINGPGAALLTISGNNTVRPIYAADFSSVSMSGITIRDGTGAGTEPPNAGTSGGGIMCNACSLTLTNMVVRNNTAPDVGGGIRAVAPLTLSIIDSLITENSANYSGGIDEGGGNAKVIRNTTISNNIAKNGTGGAHFGSGTFTIENSAIIGNKAATIPDAAGGGGQVGGLDLFQTNGTVTDTVIANNSAGFDASGNPVVAGSYGGINADGGTITFRRVMVTGNRVTNRNNPTIGSGQVGGMHLRVPGTPMTVIDSLIAGNDGGENGGGIYTSHTGPVFVINTTIANNGARGGGGIYNICDDLTVINSTIAGNTVVPPQPFEGEGGGGGILNRQTPGSTVRVQNSIIANNTANTGPQDLRGGFISNGYNIVRDTANASGFGATGDQVGVNPLLDPNGLQNNGGATLTIALRPNSPAIDKGKSPDDITTDQRGVARPTDNPAIANAQEGDGSDIGAFEIGASNGVAEKTLGNISTRLPVLTGDQVPIAGIIVSGTVAKRVIIRALGPSLGAAGVAGALENPTLQLFKGQQLLAENDNWRQDQQAAISKTGVAPADDREAAIVRTLDPGSYTAVLRGKDGTTGVGLIDAYDLNQRPNSKLVNISTRGVVGGGDDVLIGGFIVGPTTRVVVRAIGPSLADAGINGALQDPALKLVNANGEVVRANDDWKGIQRDELKALGLQPSRDRESALVETLIAGSYTAVVRSADSSSGIGLVEVYNLR